MRHICLLLSVVIVIPSIVVLAADRELIEKQLAKELEPVIAAHAGQAAVMVQHLDNGATFAVRAEEPMPTASLIKLPIMLAAYDFVAQGRVSLDDTVEFAEADRVPGSGILTQHFTAGLKLPLRDAIRLMIAYSDNIATNLVMKSIGIETTNEYMDRLNCPNTRIHAFVFQPKSSIAPERSQKFGLGSTTAKEMISLLERLHHGELATKDATKQLREHLLACDDKERLNRHLPAGTKVAMKTGSVTAVRTVAGIVETPAGPFAICVLTNENKDKSWTKENAGELLSAEIAKRAYDVFMRGATDAHRSPSVGPLSVGTHGELVEDLQRALNRRTEPSPMLTIDGEFGPVTEQAVKAFQQQAQLAVTGAVDAATWEALGPLLPPDGSVTEIDAFNRPLEPTQPAETLTAAPVVTCKAWVVGDVATGKVFAGADDEVPRDFASTTKMMTAYVVLKLAEARPELLEEVVTVSTTADETPGSTAAVRAGEQLTVRELLFGLMLPSGNDAATAFAEFCGPEAQGSPSLGLPPDITPSERFILAMNQTAKDLGMTRTRYANPHGLTHADHKSTARDQFTLARAALRLPSFRDLVQTRQYATVVRGPGGYRRVAAWKNTNRLLEIPGYAGVKTGTTDAAGACLVSLSRHEGREAIVVVLGATSSDARYVDTRNLFRWYWQQPQERP